MILLLILFMSDPWFTPGLNYVGRNAEAILLLGLGELVLEIVIISFLLQRGGRAVSNAQLRRAERTARSRRRN